MASDSTPRKRLCFDPDASTSSEKEKLSVKVVVRMRPVSNPEEDISTPLIRYLSSKEIMTGNKRFHFNRVFKPETGQLEVYQSTVAPMIPDIIAGYECTVFAYGETGSGKSYTVTGENCQCPLNWKTDSKAGFIPRAAAHIFETLREERFESCVKVSYLELYNEEIRDLLSDDESLLNIYDLGERSVFIQGIKEVAVTNGKALCRQLEKGNYKRLSAPTLMNHNSTRAHTVFTITVHTRDVSISGDDILRAGKLTLVDLAGSENMTQFACKDLKPIELVTINKSLLTLGRVIHALFEKGQGYIPYRESKLTKCLKDSLGGHAKTCIIATISISSSAYDETVKTLEYASRARHIKNTPLMSEKVTRDQMMKAVLDEIDRLQKDIDAARDRTGFFVNEENHQKLLDTMEFFTGKAMTMEEINRNQAKRIEELEEVVKIRSKEFDDNVLMCKKSKNLLKKAKWIIRKQDDVSKQQQYVSETYETEASRLQKQAKHLSSTTKKLSKETGILQEKLQTEHRITLVNENVNQAVVSHITDMLTEILEESEKVQFRDENIRTLFKQGINDLKSQLEHPLEELTKALELFDTLSSQELSIRDESRSFVNNNIDTIREETLDMKAKLTSHLYNLNELEAEDMETLAEDFRIMSSDYSHSVNDLTEIIYKKLTAEDATLKQNIIELKLDVVIADTETYLMAGEQIGMDIRNQINETQDMISQQESHMTREHDTTERIETVVEHVETTVHEFTNVPTNAVPDMDSVTASSVDSQCQAEYAKISLVTDMEGAVNIFDVKIDTAVDEFDSIGDNRVSLHDKLECFAQKSNKALKEHFIDQFTSVTCEGTQELEVATTSSELSSPREQVSKRFKAETPLNDNETPSTSKADLGNSEEPGSSNQP